MKVETQVVVIGGGLTGAGILRDLSLRGIDAVLLERRDFNAGASGANHGLLHSGGRYVVNDAESAEECVKENAILKRVASACIEDCGGLFIALNEDSDEYVADFLSSAEKVGLKAEQLDVEQVLEEEPYVNPNIKAAIRVPDASINPFLATRANLKAAKNDGARVFLHTQVIAMKREGSKIVEVEAINRSTGEKITVKATQVVSAAGPWVDQIGALAGVDVKIAYSKGSLLITNARLVNNVINRLRPPSNGDIVVPGETVTITGTTSIRVNNLDYLTTPAEEVDLLVNEAEKLVPEMNRNRYIRVYAGVRPLVLSDKANGDRGISRTFTIFDHEKDGIENFTTIAGGKLTTYRLMAEKVCDLVTQKLSLDKKCTTDQTPLPGSEKNETLDTAKRLANLVAPVNEGEVICECEFVSKKQLKQLVEELIAEGAKIDPNTLRLRSRLGMGSCQGGFCGYRTIGFLYEEGIVKQKEGNKMLREFLERRWHGTKPVLWGDQLRQEQLLEAIYCGSLNIDGNL